MVLQVLSTAPGSSSGSGNAAVATTTPVYTYKVRIINPAKKSEVIVRQLNKSNAKFESVTALCIKLIEEFKEQVPKQSISVLGTVKGVGKQKCG